MDPYVIFPVSGVRTYVFLPPLVAFAVSFFASMGGVSGAFLLLPFQISFLHFTSPAVSSTNFVYNICAIPSGVYRYIKEGRMAWPLAWILVFGTLPGVFIGYYIRVTYLPNPRAFRLFVGLVLLYVGMRLLFELWKEITKNRKEARGRDCAIKTNRFSAKLPAQSKVKTVSYSFRSFEYEFGGKEFSFEPIQMFLLAVIVGIVGGAYGIGGGSIIAPLCVAIFGLPVYTVAGAALLSTFLTSIAGVSFYSIIPAKAGISTSPDWLLGILFGLGGILGMYCGARMQKHIPQILIKAMLSLILTSLAISYVLAFF
jgi:uncharacterized membrane protein YfcA